MGLDRREGICEDVGVEATFPQSINRARPRAYVASTTLRVGRAVARLENPMVLESIKIGDWVMIETRGDKSHMEKVGKVTPKIVWAGSHRYEISSGDCMSAYSVGRRARPATEKEIAVYQRKRAEQKKESERVEKQRAERAADPAWSLWQTLSTFDNNCETEKAVEILRDLMKRAGRIT